MGLKARRWWFAVILASSGAFPATLVRASETTTDQRRKTVWTVGLSGHRHSLKAGDGNEMIGNSASVQLGTGYISHSWYSLVSLDFLLGPYEPSRNRTLKVDYVGTGATIWTGYSAQTLDLRSQAGGYGFALGLNYGDLVGRQTGTADGTGSEGEKISDYVMRVTNFSLLPAIFFSWLKEARPRGNTPELLTTRIEGYLLTIGAAMPLLISYQAKYHLDSPMGVSDEQDSLSPSRTKTTDKGRLRGYSILVSFTTFLGI